MPRQTHTALHPPIWAALDHEQTHPDRARLTEYFQQWCQALHVEPLYPRLKAMLQGAAWS